MKPDNEGDVWKMPKKAIRAKERLLGPKNGYIEGLKKAKRTLSWNMVCESLCIGGSQNEWEMDHLIDLKFSNKETESRIKIYAKN